ncbi:uncharacterized protein FTOL_12003 [Fusarium torulosum]|uniref:Uncharacterized protein n=1 Tax=Fusarium torulosum TaxID=33205 RepID=A0AAE8MJS6_9HYPO|nr:uncharacterized protein FTOL_12003 [Fusarium torulosum]
MTGSTPEHPRLILESTAEAPVKRGRQRCQGYPSIWGVGKTASATETKTAIQDGNGTEMGCTRRRKAAAAFDEDTAYILPM